MAYNFFAPLRLCVKIGMPLLPNLLTFSRLLITPLVALSILGGSYGQALGWLIASGVTD